MARPFLLQTRWLLGHVIIVLMVASMIGLGFWQLSRLHERKDHNRAIRSALLGPPLTAVPPANTPNWRHVSLAGSWNVAGSEFLRYPLQDGQPGYDVVTPFVTTSGSILVDRGWVPLDANKGDSLSSLAGAPGTLTIDASFHRAEHMSGKPGKTSGTPPVPTVTAISAPWLQLRAVSGPGDGVLLDGPDLSEGPHFAYTLQWWSFCVICVLGWAALLYKAYNDPAGTTES